MRHAPYSRIIGSILAGVLVSSLLAGCATVKDIPAVPAEVKLWQSTKVDFGASLYLTAEHQAFLRLVDQMDSDQEIQNLASKTTARRGEPVRVVLLFKNCHGTTDQYCEMRGDFDVSKPDGSRYGGYENRLLWSTARPELDKPTIARPYLEFIADPMDPSGEYQFSVTIRNANGGDPITLMRTLTILDNSQ